MGAPQDGVFDAAVMRAVGAELRWARENIPWTRSELVSRLPSEIHVQTLATYERGTRQLSLGRFVEICQTMGISAPEVLGAALQRAEIGLQASGVRVDLHAVLSDKRTDLGTLRRWARNRVESDPQGSGIAHLDWALVQEMATVFGIDRSEFVKLLATFTPRPTPRRKLI
jgi:transcriptional regulator with XRE-family HTH domain